MVDKLLKKIFRRRHTSAGFTLLELLVSVAIGWIVISGLIYMVVQLLQTDRQEFARTETERELSGALDYIKSELEEAVYVYERECLNPRPDNLATDADETCSGLVNRLNFPANVQPVLAFWKLEQLPYSNDKPQDQFPANCGGAAVGECNNVKLSRTAPTLVIYSIRTDNPSGEWQGPARLTRYELRQFSNLSAMQKNAGFTGGGQDRDPLTDGFAMWPCDRNGNNCGAPPAYSEGGGNTNAAVLVDLVDTNRAEENASVSCPEPKSPTPSPDQSTYSLIKSDNINSFYGCVRRYTVGAAQDVIVYLRGNALERAGVSPSYNNRSYLPKVQTQVQTRSAFNRKPS